METITKNPDGSPDPGLQTTDGETAGTESERRMKKVAPIIDAETANVALQIRAMADKIEPGFNARAWLEARGL